ncbi:MAG: hypothetical protein HY765_08385 [Rhodomicrobium sp.]|nr:hypothetical protein [Rhodomicrobium sp.]
MVLPARHGGSSYSFLMILLLAGLSALAWISTYSGMMQLIAASSGDIGIGAQIAIGFAVLMLQGMIIYILDAMFSGQLRIALYPFYIIGYLVLVLISVAFAFGFYWRFLEAGAQTTQAAGSSVFEVQRALQSGQSRLELLQTTFTTLSTISSQKAATERASGGTCPNSRAGEGPRRRLRETDAQRFQFANDLIAARTGAVKADIADLNNDLQRILKKDPSTIDPGTGTRTAFIEGLDRKLGLVTTRFNALRTDPQLRQIRDEFAARAKQTTFSDDRGGKFICPDGQLQIALDGVVRSIDNLPELQKPELRSVEGSEAVIEAFRRLSNTAVGLVMHGKVPPSPERIRGEQGSPQPGALDHSFTQDKAGLSDRDYIPLMIAIFVDVCILLVSINRPFGPFFNLGQDLTRARQRGPMQGVLETFYRVFQDQFHLPQGPAPGELIAPLQDVVFDYKGDYYAAVPLDFREENYEQWAHARANAPSFESSRALERSRYLAAVFAILEGEGLVRLLGEEKRNRLQGNFLNGLDEATVRAKLDKQGSMYAQADAFRIYRFRKGKWASLLIQTVGSAAARQDADRHSQRGGGEIFAGWLRGRRMQNALPKRRQEQRNTLANSDAEDHLEEGVLPRITGRRSSTD